MAYVPHTFELCYTAGENNILTVDVTLQTHKSTILGYNSENVCYIECYF